MRITEQERQEAIEELRKLLQPGDEVSCILRHTSKSGMSRVIDLYIHKHDRRIGWLASKALGYSYDREREGLKVSGCGMDMGFHVVYSLGRVLFPEGFGIEPDRPFPKAGTWRRPKSADDAASMVAEGWKFYGRNGDASGWDNNGGYALKHRWL